MMLNKQSMKYLLVDLAILISFVLADPKLSYDESSSLLAPECHPDHADVNQMCTPVEMQPHEGVQDDDEFQGVINTASTSEELSYDESSSLLAPECHPDHADVNQMCTPVEMQPHQEGAQDDDGFQGVINTASSSEDKRVPSKTSSLDPPSKEDSIFPVGDIVEFYGEKSTYARPAIIIGHKTEESSAKYNLHLFIFQTRPTGVGAEFIYPYQAYEEGTEAFCNVGTLEVYMTPCWIVSHSIKKSGLIDEDKILYQVSYLGEENKLYPEYLPLTRIWRTINQSE